VVPWRRRLEFEIKLSEVLLLHAPIAEKSIRVWDTPVDLSRSIDEFHRLQRGCPTVDSGGRSRETRLDGCSRRNRGRLMRLYALVEAGDPEGIDVYLCEQDAQRALDECLHDEPEWRGLLRVEEVELRSVSFSSN
jgi:hypothetical protein